MALEEGVDPPDLAFLYCVRCQIARSDPSYGTSVVNHSEPCNVHSARSDTLHNGWGIINNSLDTGAAYIDTGQERADGNCGNYVPDTSNGSLDTNSDVRCYDASNVNIIDPGACINRLGDKNVATHVTRNCISSINDSDENVGANLTRDQRLFCDDDGSKASGTLLINCPFLTDIVELRECHRNKFYFKTHSVIPCQHRPKTIPDLHTAQSRTKNKPAIVTQPEIIITKPGSKQDSAYASLERHSTPSECFLRGSIISTSGSWDHGYSGDHVTTQECSIPGEEDDDDRDSGTEECSSSDSEDTVVLFEPNQCTKEKLHQRTKEMLIVLRDQYVKLIQEVSEQLVQLLQERHELKEQVEMRKIAIEQLVRFQSESFVGSRDQDSVQMSVIVSGDE